VPGLRLGRRTTGGRCNRGRMLPTTGDDVHVIQGLCTVNDGSSSS
jgi:hypothetical protein